MRKVLFVAAIGLIAVWAYDEFALWYSLQPGNTTLSPLYGTNVNLPVPEFYLPIIGAGIITLLAVTA